MWKALSLEPISVLSADLLRMHALCISAETTKHGKRVCVEACSC